MANKQPSIVNFGTKVAVFAGLFLTIYYFGWLKPRLELPTALLAAENQVHILHSHLLQNRLLLLEFIQLDPKDPQFNEEYNRILGRWQQAQQENIELLQTVQTPEPLVGAPTEQVAFFNDYLPQAQQSTVNRHHSAMTQQQTMLNSITLQADALRNIFAFAPQSEIAALSPASDAQLLRERSQAAIVGLQNISKKVESLPGTSHTRDIQQALSNQIATFESIITAIDSGDTGAITTARDDAVSRFLELKVKAFASMQGTLTDKAAISFVTDQTNILLEYQWLLDQVRHHQRNL